MCLKVVVIGGGAAGMSAAASVRRESADAEIVLFEKGDWISYAMCGLPYFVGGVTDDTEDLITYTPEAFWERRRVRVLTRHSVQDIDPQSKEVTVFDPDGRKFTERYDRLIIATGARSRAIERISGVEGAFDLHTMDDALAVRKYLDGRRPKEVLVVGSGYVGLEMAHELRERGLGVTLWKGRATFLHLDDEGIDRRIETKLAERGVEIVQGRRFERVEERPGGGIVVYGSGSKVETCLLILAIGTAPSMPHTSGQPPKTGLRGAIAVNSMLQTSWPDVWAVGDAAEMPHRMLSGNEYIALATTANRMGRIAGHNAVHTDSPLEFKGIVGTVMTVLFDLDVARTGLTDETARRAGFDPVSVTITANDRADYFPDAGELTLRLSADKVSGRLLGAEIAGPPGTGKRIDAISVALYTGLKVPDIAQLDLAYVPPRATVWDPLLIAGHELSKKIAPVQPGASAKTQTTKP